MGVFVCGFVSTINRNCVIDPHQTGFVGKGSDRLQLIKFLPSHAPGKGVFGGAKFLAQPYLDSQPAVFASPPILSAFSFTRDNVGGLLVC